MAVIQTCLAALVLVCISHCSQTPVSALDQYKAREDLPQPPQLFNEATDQPLKIHKPHRFNFPLKKSPTKTEHQKKGIVPDLQVGCGDGLFVEPTVSSKKVRKHGAMALKLRRRRDTDEGTRKRRGYYPISAQFIQTPASVSFSLWKPPLYQLSRPYYIPVWGASGRLPIYFPPQPLFINPGFPVDNPTKEYLPPTTKTTTEAPVPDIWNRFNDFDDDRPIWGVAGSNAATQRPPTTTQVAPTRRSRPPGQTPATHPPILHGNNDRIDEIFANNLSVAESEPVPSPIVRTTTSRPTTEKRQPSRCVWAIISCCSPTSGDVSHNCFEQLGCPGAFWDTSPCDSNFARAAIASALNYYNAKK